VPSATLDPDTTTPITPTSRRRPQGKAIREFILTSVDEHPSDLVAVVVQKFDLSRQAANKHVHRLISEGVLQAEGQTKSRVYKLVPLTLWLQTYKIVPQLAEHDVWDNDISPLLNDLPKNVRDIWQFSFTEIFNNAIDHSNGSEINVVIDRTAVSTKIVIRDDGVGIFKKIQVAMNLPDQRNALLELSKGKLTTDPSRHTGQGIFFTSRLLDEFNILSGELVFNHFAKEDKDWLVERSSPTEGTTIFMKVSNQSRRLDEDVFKEYSSEDGETFAKTVVPVTLARYGDEKLVSRSQARQLLARVDRFETVVLDFRGVESIGQAFADEIFRVFAKSHPDMSIVPVDANESVSRSIKSAQASGNLS
jgi:anti-sigma regulatory factor (Ser/Thr protein kinase)